MSWSARLATVAALACCGLAACNLEATDPERDEAEQAMTAAGPSCLVHADCPSGTLCGFEPGTCGTVGGVCSPISEPLGTASPMSEPAVGCAAGAQPVCGCDGQDYANACAAWQLGVSVWFDGPCAQGPPPSEPPAGDGSCGGAQCDSGQFCFTVDGSCAVDSGPDGTCRSLSGPCTSSAEPVCGCDGQSYDSPCDAVRSGVSVVHLGPC